MATNAERQRNYRLRHLKDVDGNGQRLNVIVESPVKRVWERLAVCYCVTQRAMLKRLLLDAERCALDQVQTSTQASTDYFEGKLRLSPVSQIKPQSRQDSELRSNEPSITDDIKHRESLRLLEDLLAYLESWPTHPTRTEWMAKISEHLDDPAARLVAALNVERAGGRFLPTGLGVPCLATGRSVKVRVNEED